MTVNAILDTVHSHLGALIQKFHEYFPDIRDMTEWDCIRDPFCSEAREHCVLTGRAEEELIYVASDRSLQLLFRESKSLGQFWVFVAKEYPTLGAAALKVLVPFSTTYLCENGFSINYIFHSYENKLN